MKVITYNNYAGFFYRNITIFVALYNINLICNLMKINNVIKNISTIFNNNYILKNNQKTQLNKVKIFKF